MADFKHKKFKDEAVLLDGNAFDHCEFKNCTLVFNGITGVSLSHTAINGCRWEFAGPASNTMAFLTALYQMGPEMQGIIEQTFENIRGLGNDGITVH